VEKLITRSYQDTDAPALTRFFIDMTAAAGGDPGYTEDETRAWFSAGIVRDPAADTRLVMAGRELAGAALLGTPAAGGCRVDAFGGVLPAWRGRGLGRQLIRWQIRRAADLHTATAPQVPWQLDVDAFTTEAAALRLFDQFGFRPVRYWFQMAMSLDELQPAAMPAGLRIRAFSTDMARALYVAQAEVMADHFNFEQRGFDAWSKLELHADGFRADLTRIALDGDEIAAYVMVSEDEDNRVCLEWVGTRQPWRRRGLASALIFAALEAASAEGKTGATIGVDAQSPTGAVGVYERAGFSVASSWVSYQRPVG
jgi:mycothiol synthase